jgi:hypothetical protein
LAREQAPKGAKEKEEEEEEEKKRRSASYPVSDIRIPISLPFIILGSAFIRISHCKDTLCSTS